MQVQPRFRLIRRLLLPYSWERPLSYKQALRIIITWALFFGLAMSLCSLPFALSLTALSLSKVAFFFLLAFLSGLFIFGVLAWVVVWMGNRTARIMQQRRADSNTSGGRYGS